MLGGILKLLKKEPKYTRPRVRRRVIRLSYSYEGGEEESYEREEPKVEENREIKDDIEKAVEHLIEAARHVACSYCRGRIVDEIDFLLRFHYKTKLVESGVDPKDVDKVFEERYASLVKKRVEKIREELKVGDRAYMIAVKDKATETLKGQSS